MYSSTHGQSGAMSVGQKPIECPIAFNIEQSQDFLNLLGNSEFTGGSYRDPWQDDFMSLDANNFEFDEGQLNSDSLKKILESENDDPAALAFWENSHV